MPTDFDSAIWNLLRRIPKGKVTTYERIAIALGKPNAARAVGNACNRNPFALKVPCHRVVCSNAGIGGYSKGAKRKIALLKSEGIRIKNNKVLLFSERLFKF
ncbi:MAG: MGMT family protein [Candidatus Diapherotrites archaeon]|nr:MGMT family protein [Candidatus Diapherotrites archaeon]